MDIAQAVAAIAAEKFLCGHSCPAFPVQPRPIVRDAHDDAFLFLAHADAQTQAAVFRSAVLKCVFHKRLKDQSGQLACAESFVDVAEDFRLFALVRRAVQANVGLDKLQLVRDVERICPPFRLRR